jgi:peroxiredoxin
MKLSLLLTSLSFGIYVSAQSVQDITEKHMGALLTDIKAYIEANPEAADLNEAFQSGIQAAYVTGQNEEVVTLLDLQFDGLVEQDAPEQELIQTGMMLAQFAQQNGNRDAAEKVKAVFEERAAENSDSSYPQVVQALTSMLGKPGIGDVPELSGTTIEGENISLEDYRGKVVLLDFWATWCPPCVEKMPEVKAVYDTYHEKGFDVIGISLDRSMDPLKSFIEEEKLGWANILDGDQEASLADQFGVTSIPSLFLLDQNGKIVALDPHGGDLEAEVAKLLGE